MVVSRGFALQLDNDPTNCCCCCCCWKVSLFGSTLLTTSGSEGGFAGDIAGAGDALSLFPLLLNGDASKAAAATAANACTLGDTRMPDAGLATPSSSIAFSASLLPWDRCKGVASTLSSVSICAPPAAGPENAAEGAGPVDGGVASAVGTKFATHVVADSGDAVVPSSSSVIGVADVLPAASLVGDFGDADCCCCCAAVPAAVA